MTYRERRLRVFDLMAEAGQLIRDAGDDRSMLWRVATDDLSDAVTKDSPELLREAFTDAARDFWLRDNHLHSRKVEERRALLRLVTPDEFETIVYPRGRGAA